MIHSDTRYTLSLMAMLLLGKTKVYRDFYATKLVVPQGRGALIIFPVLSQNAMPGAIKAPGDLLFRREFL